ncbi:MAG: hypothetical protein QI197_00190 [Candidatus Korarchaeota archaeon]|nr:hypothetical protein [Candidatus Korarchaeota archaeon]
MKDLVLEELGDRVLAALVFGSLIYWRDAKDVDLLIVVKGSLRPKEKMEVEYKISSRALRRGLPPIDVHVMGLSDFRDNLSPGTFLSGLALGYRVLIDRINVDSLIASFLRELSREDYVLYNRYGRWNLSEMAKILLRRKLRTEGKDRQTLNLT